MDISFSEFYSQNIIFNPLVLYEILKRRFEMISRLKFSRSFVTFCVKKRLRGAFTLAEVLITLGIIGVVAAITMPTLIQNHKNQETIARLQKSISVLNSGMRKMMADEGVDQLDYLELNDCKPGVISDGETQTCLQPYFKKYFNIVQDNVGVSSSSEDFYPISQLKLLNGRKNLLAAFWGITQRYAFVTTDGIMYVPYSWPFSGGTRNALVDINAQKGPNQFGRDIFVLEYRNGSYIPAGGDTWNDSSSNDYCNPESGLGYGCAARIVQDGWKIKY